MATVTLPNSLNLSPHLSAQKYFLVCTLTVAAWDTLVLTPRDYRLLKKPEWSTMKILFHFMRFFMPAEFAVVAVGFFNTSFSIEQCEKFYLFEPICTAILLGCASAVHVIRIHAIYDRSRPVLFYMGSLFALQVVVTAVCCGFYRSVPLLQGQGCIAGPKFPWVGIYWAAPTLLYLSSLLLAVNKSIQSLQAKPLTPWKLMLRDGLNLYGAIFVVNLTNLVFWFAIKPTGVDDPIRTIVTSMAAVLTTTMTLRIVLGVRGTLVNGGSFALTGTTAHSSTSRTTHVISTRSAVGNPGPGGVTTNLSTHGPTYTLDDMRGKPESEWMDNGVGQQDAIKNVGFNAYDNAKPGVQVTIDREVGYEQYPRGK